MRKDIIPAIYDNEANTNKKNQEFEAFEVHAMKSSGGNNPKNDSEIKKIVNITIGLKFRIMLLRSSFISIKK